ncbi:MAG: hypothetical protein AAGF23_08140 [Acidobacteriota bacterium]
MVSSFPSATPRHAFFLRWLKISLVAGAVYDLIFAVIIVAAPELPEKLLQVRPPGDPFYLWLIAVFLTMLAAFYFYAAYDPRAYSGNIRIAIVGRTAGFIAMCGAAVTDPTLWGLYVLAAGDLLFAVSHAIFWWPIRR